MQRGHLEIEDGVGSQRRKIRLARVGHGLKRLVLVGSDGFVSLAALRWLTDQDAAFVMLERNGMRTLIPKPARVRTPVLPIQDLRDASCLGTVLEAAIKDMGPT
jgi:hypothetical protein